MSKIKIQFLFKKKIEKLNVENREVINIVEIYTLFLYG